MKKFLLFSILLLLTNCFGYQPIFLSSDIDYNIRNIKKLSQNKINNDIERRLKSYKYDDSKQDISIEISSTNEERVLSRDNKGDPIIFEMNIIVNVKILFDDQTEKEFKLKENFSYNNRSNKFDLKLYRDNVQKNITEKIVRNMITKIRSM